MAPLSPGKAAHAYRPDIDGLRAISVGLVVVFHAFPALLRGGFVGVDVFFVISGFLISTIILEGIDHNSFSFAVFYARRIRRIFPALGLVLASSWIMGYLALTPSQLLLLGREMVAGALFYLNFQVVKEIGYFDAAAAAKPLLHLWSLGVEEQFYIAWPLFLIGLSKWRKPVLAGILAIVAASFAANLIYAAVRPQAAFYIPATRLWELALGGALAYVQMRSQTGSDFAAGVGRPKIFAWIEAGCLSVFRTTQRHDGLASIAGLGLILVAAGVIDTSHAYPGFWAVLPNAGALLVIAAGAQASVNRRLLSHPAMVRVGLVSYPLYLWHWPVLFFARIFFGETAAVAIAAIAVSVALAFLTYQLCERPLHRVYRRFPVAVTAPLCLFISGLAVLGQLSVKKRGFDARFPQIATLNAFVRQPIAAGWRAGTCFFLTENHVDEPRAFDQNACSFSGPRTKPRLLIIGDSFAASLYPGLAEQLGDAFDIGQLTAGFCVPLIENIIVSGNKTATERCSRINAYVFAQIRATQPDVLLVHGIFNVYETSEKWKYPDFLARFQENILNLSKTIPGKIIIVGQAPLWSPDLPVVLETYLRTAQMPPRRLKEGIDQQALATATVMKNMAWPQNATYISLADALCNADGCLAFVGDAFPDDLVTRDYGHFTQSGSRYVARELIVPAIRSTLPVL